VKIDGGCWQSEGRTPTTATIVFEFKPTDESRPGAVEDAVREFIRYLPGTVVLGEDASYRIASCTVISTNENG
jgi:hypothetical protein